MRTILQVLMSALVLMLGMVSLPANAAPLESFYPAVVNQQTMGGDFHSIVLNSNEIKHMTLGQAAAILGGAIVGGGVVDRVLDGTVFTIMGVVAGAVLGNEWYERGMWPF